MLLVVIGDCNKPPGRDLPCLPASLSSASASGSCQKPDSPTTPFLMSELDFAPCKDLACKFARSKPGSFGKPFVTFVLSARSTSAPGYPSSGFSSCQKPDVARPTHTRELANQSNFNIRFLLSLNQISLERDYSRPHYKGPACEFARSISTLLESRFLLCPPYTLHIWLWPGTGSGWSSQPRSEELSSSISCSNYKIHNWLPTLY
ncbi:hypothetical protein LY76DRAFT_377678 [Colletotrichum caudatum]|nr:hypothetical protein LY76DRAFT_377678 [Colletotrichum caudatum]